MKFRDALRRLLADGWVEVAVKGSHHQYKHPTKPGRVTLAFSSLGHDIPAGTWKSVARQAGLEGK